MEYKLQEEFSFQLNLFCLFFQAFFLVYALGCLSIYYGEVRDLLGIPLVWICFGLKFLPTMAIFYAVNSEGGNTKQSN